MSACIPETYLNQMLKGDCIRILMELPDDSVDAIITDPPYCSGGRTIGERQIDPNTKYTDNQLERASFDGDVKDARSWLRWMWVTVAEGYRILKPGGYCLMFCDWRQLPTATDAIQMGGIRWNGIIAWNKGLGARAPHKGYFRHQCEYIVWGTKGKCLKRTDAGPFPGCYEHHVRQADKFHITGKPTPLMEDLMEIVPEGGIVLDPFAGSGTTCVAAVNKGRQYIGIEKMPEYWEIACKRIAEAKASVQSAADAGLA